jgi:hypothetical protein
VLSELGYDARVIDQFSTGNVIAAAAPALSQ